jgi:hypothetical protein
VAGFCPALHGTTCTAVQLEKLVLRFQTHAYHRALVIIHQRRSVIEALADELVTRPDATVSAARLEEALKAEPEEVSDSVRDSLPFKDLIPTEVSFHSTRPKCSCCSLLFANHTAFPQTSCTSAPPALLICTASFP